MNIPPIGTLCEIIRGGQIWREEFLPHIGRFVIVTGPPFEATEGFTCVPIDKMPPEYMKRGGLNVKCLRPIVPPGDPDKLGTDIDTPEKTNAKT